MVLDHERLGCFAAHAEKMATALAKESTAASPEHPDGAAQRDSSMHFENDPAELNGWLLGTVFGFMGIAALGIPTWLCLRTGELNLGIPVAFCPIAAVCLVIARAGFAPQISVDLEREPRQAHVVRWNLLTRRKRRRTYPIPDDACVILEESDCVYSLTIRRAFLRHIYLTQPRDGDEAGPLVVNVAKFLGIELEDRRPLHETRWKP